jgi:uncharacterized membrane protein
MNVFIDIDTILKSIETFMYSVIDSGSNKILIQIINKYFNEKFNSDFDFDQCINFENYNDNIDNVDDIYIINNPDEYWLFFNNINKNEQQTNNNLKFFEFLREQLYDVSFVLK